MDYALPPPLFAQPPSPAGHAACSGCGLCQLVCPVWRSPGPLGRDVEMTPHGRAKALQNGAQAADIATSIGSCTYCGACDAVCPENLPIVELTLELQRQLHIQSHASATACVAPLKATTIAVSPAPTFLVLPDPALRDAADLLAKVLGLIGIHHTTAVAADDGSDISAALVAGHEVSIERIEQFLRPLRGAGTLVVADGLLLRHLLRWLPGKTLTGLGPALSRNSALQQALRPGDLYVIDAQTYNLDYEANVRHYDALRHATGCQTNLDLQRIAMPADDAAQAQWILRGLQPQRIVIEKPQHRPIFAALGYPVAHVAELLQGQH